MNTKSLPLRPRRSFVDMQGDSSSSSSNDSDSSSNDSDSSSSNDSGSSSSDSDSSSSRRRTQYIKLLEHLLSDDSVRVETTPYWGPKTMIGMTAYRAKVSFFLLAFVVLPMSYMLWLVGASVWYILRGAELARRSRLEVQYQEYSRTTMDSYDKKHL